MAGTNLFLQVVIGLEEVTPDGSECHGCGDACYLFMVQAFYHVEGQQREFVDAYLCSSCDEMMRESPDAGEEWKQI
jgi:hypothetical protein